MQSYIIGLRFQKVGKVYHFDASKFPDLQIGDFAVVETSRGKQLGEVVLVVEDPSQKKNGRWKPVHHIATARDLVIKQILEKKEAEALINCHSKAAEFSIEGIKIVSAEYSFDGSRLSFLYSTEENTKINITKLRSSMKRSYPRSRVEMRQVGPRDVAKILGGMGACGLENRCCALFLTEFSPISIKMAKAQGISLSPTEITGMCGRLRCCLIYEYNQYLEARKHLPKYKKRVVTPMGEGIVKDVFPLRESVLVLLENGKYQEFPHEQVEPWKELQSLKKAAQEPCAKQQEGSSDCGRQTGQRKPNPGSKKRRKKR
ncbi:MAG: regulatory iron-sulfur-containing complex subunit RicT [Chloroflexota bacterium]|nr:regulatory iron-sulfur-containing complex subunit RicT [Chloroflexota bacterium]